MTTKQLGNIGEAKALAKFVELQIPVYIPFGDNEKSDLIADFNGKLNKVQVKTSEEWIDSEKFVISLVSSTMHRNSGEKHKYTHEEIDYFACYNLQSNVLFLLPIEVVEGQTMITIRHPYVNVGKNQYKRINWEDYTFEKVFKT